MKKLYIDPEFKSLIPKMEPDEYRLLESNILSEGIRDPLVVWGDVLVDGHNRYKIAKEHNLEFDTVERAFVDRNAVKLWIIDNQLGRRNLIPAIKIELALLKKPLIREKAKENQKGGRGGVLLPQISAEAKVDTRGCIAELAGVSHDTVTKYNKLREHASAELLEKVREGKKKINTAYREMQAGTTKVCSSCCEEKALSEFGVGKTNCRDCQRRSDTRSVAQPNTQTEIETKEGGFDISTTVKLSQYLSQNGSDDPYTTEDLKAELDAVVKMFSNNFQATLAAHTHMLSDDYTKEKVKAALSEAEAAIREMKECLI